MARTQQPLSPPLLRLTEALGERLQLARKRRKLSASLFAERVGITRNTLQRVEAGDPSVALGTYLRTLRILGLEEDLALLAADDSVGRRLQDLALLEKTAGAKQTLEYPSGSTTELRVQQPVFGFGLKKSQG